MRHALPSERAAGREVPVMPPALRHFARRMGNTAAAQTAREVFNQTAPVVIRQPIFQVMETRKIFAGAFAAAITIDLDVMQQPLGCPILLRLIQHARERERNFKERPAIHSLKIYRGRLDSVVDLEGEMFVTRADQRLTDRRRPLADRERLPIPTACSGDEPIELILSFENGFERQARFERAGTRTS